MDMLANNEDGTTNSEDLIQTVLFKRQVHLIWACSVEALPGVFGNRGKRAFISGEQGNKGHILRGTGEQRQYFGTGNIRKQIFDF